MCGWRRETLGLSEDQRTHSNSVHHSEAAAEREVDTSEPRDLCDPLLSLEATSLRLLRAFQFLQRFLS